MVLGRKCKFLLFLFILCLSPRLFADNIPVINITEKTDPKIAELYQQLQNTQEKIDNLESERRDKLSENYTAMREKENSKENRLLTGLSTAATGLGGMQLAQGLAEQSADKKAEADMAAYIKTMRCSYGSGNFVTAGPEPVELPGGNDATLMSLRSEYIALAKSLKERKESLGLKPGIESEEILDKANMGLYDDENLGITGGQYASLYRATALDSEDDQAQINSDKEKSANRVKYGGIAAGTGVVGGIVGNVIINKDAPKEQSSEINSEYNAHVREAKAEQQTLSAQLNAAIAENKKKFEEYNKKLQEHKDNLSQIQSASPQCQEQLAGYVSVIESLEPIENETDEVPDITFPEYNSDLLQKCTDCETKGGVFNPNTLECPCPTDKPVERDGVCSEEIVEPTPPENPISTPEEPPVENPEDPDVCGVGKRHTAGFGITEGVTRIGDPCSSALVLEGVVFKRRNGTCGCSAVLCDSRNGRASMAQGGRCVCDASRGYKDDQGRCVCDTENGWQNVDGACVRAAPQSQPEAPTPTSRELKYYNCGNVNPGRDNATQEMLTNGTCKYVQDFNRRKVTPMQADGLMREWALEKYNDVIECDADSHRTQAEKNSYGDKWRNCVSTGPNEQYYEFVFKSLSGGDGGFYDALCSIWGLKSGVHSCKDATEEQCNKISAAVGRSFFHGGSASLTNNGVYIGSRAISQSIECNIVEHQRAQSGPVALFNTTITQEDMHRFGNINPLRFYDKIFQVNANSGVIYDVLNHYLFDELHLPVKPFSCGSSFVDNTNYFDGPRSQYTELNNQYSRCVEDSQRFSGGGEHAAQAMGGAITGCRRQYPIETKTGDLLTCTYDGHQIDFLFQKLDVIWDRKSTAGYQALRCYTEGGDFTGKSCVLADKAACDRFNAAFAREFPNTRGMEWDPEMNTCVLKDVSQVRNVQRVAETVGFVAVTLVSAIGGGPVVWVLSAVEATALVTEAVTEESLNNWAERFLTDAGRCNGSGASSACADAVLRNHIARIIGGIRYFSETQATAIKNKIEQLTAMLSTEIISAIVDKGVASGYISEDHEPDMEKSIQAYYGTTLTGGERTLLAANRVATVLTFATLIGGGVMAGLRQSFKRGWINISKAKQAKWIDLRILRQADVAEDVFAMSKMGQRAMNRAGQVVTKPAEVVPNTRRAKSLKSEFADIGVQEVTVYRDAQTGRILSQNEVLQRIDNMPTDDFARIGVREEKAANGTLKYRDVSSGRYISQEEVLQRIDNMPADDFAAIGVRQTSAYKDTRTGRFISEEEVLNRIDNMPSNPRPAETGTPRTSGSGTRGRPATPQSQVRSKLGDKLNNDIADIKAGNHSELHIPKSRLTDDEWKALKEELAREGLNVEDQGGMYYVIKKADAPGGRVNPKPSTRPRDPAPKSSAPVRPAPKTTPTPRATPTPKATPTPIEPVTPKLTPQQETREWQALYEKYAPKNQSLDEFRNSFGNNLDEVKEYAKNWDSMLSPEEARQRVDQMIADFSKKYDPDGAIMPSYYKYVGARREAEATARELGTDFKFPDLETPQLKGWTQEQLDEAKRIYDATNDADVAHLAPKDDFYSTWDPSISQLKRELQNSNSSYSSIFTQVDNYVSTNNLHLERGEMDNVVAWIKGGDYDMDMLRGTFGKDSGLSDISVKAKDDYRKFLAQKSQNVRKIDEAAGLHSGSQSDFIADIKSTSGKNIVAKNEFVQNFVSTRVSLYEDIVTNNPSIYNRARRWNQLSLEDREKLCKEIFEIADTKLGVEHTEFAVRDLVKDFGKKETTAGLHIDGKVYISNRHFPDMSFQDIMNTISHEQAHKVDRLAPNKGILGSQLSDLGRSEGHIQGYTGSAYEDYRLELTEQSSWQVGEAVKKAMAKLGL